MPECNLSVCITKLSHLLVTFSFYSGFKVWLCKAKKKKKKSLHYSFDVIWGPSVSHKLYPVVVKTKSSAETQNKTYALITQQFPKLFKNKAAFSTTRFLTSGCSSDSLPSHNSQLKIRLYFNNRRGFCLVVWQTSRQRTIAKGQPFSGTSFGILFARGQPNASQILGALGKI